MIIGVPKEIKRHEYRISLTPAGAADLTVDGHTVLVEAGAGDGSGFGDDAYLQAGAAVCTREELFGRSELIVKVKEPIPGEYDLLREGQALFTYLHLAPNSALTEILLTRGVTAIGYETLEEHGTLPLLSPMSEIAGRMAPLMGAFYLQRIHGGTGVLAYGATGVKPARALVLGAGMVGTNAVRASIGLGMDTTVLNRGIDRLQRVEELFPGRVKTLVLYEQTLREEIREADLVIGAILVPGGKTPVLIPREMLRVMKRGCVLVDVSIDQGGCAETSRPTTHDDPVYDVDGIIHYTVANMPGAYPWTSTLALTNATLPYVKVLADRGIDRALKEEPALAGALNTYRGCIAHKALAKSLGVMFRPFSAE
ncbi:alanine dehydrogenase [Geobacter sp. AOG1]|uniref:alanine dehydrogenase n=1 Tax=Geobacter sp. AOG1 TaxID=1566346 RepID=UPI001CC7CC11|nr:alanine dehydrogenase [Geobacter sp. AOG1]GFE58797.1 alanine dehydrogenase [Geobacter sp. AOG1]